MRNPRSPWSCALSVAALLAPCPLPAASSARALVTEETGVISYRDYRHGARIRAAVPEVVRALQAKTGLHEQTASVGQRRLSAALEQSSLTEVLRTLLDGYSYVVYTPRAGGSAELIVLSARPRVPSEGIRSPGAEADASSTPALMEEDSGPQTLDEFQALENPQQHEDVVAGTDPVAAMEIGRARREQALLRALAALDSPYPHLHRQALEQLMGIPDARVTEALFRAASSESSGDASLRSFAAERLWEHAANLRFADSHSVAALEDLLVDSDPSVRSVAARALDDGGRYQAE